LKAKGGNEQGKRPSSRKSVSEKRRGREVFYVLSYM